MKTLLERIEKLSTSTLDWFSGKERELHREQAAVTRELALKVQELEHRVAQLERRATFDAVPGL